ncbi:hypothetical protein [Egicoccus sp. AB-alg2]|uniref:hypothetical protein n=1 Tax=Egicoccus sp. AB-alg2 TaxID=3242693 RepID=UPI00359EB96F
MLFPQHQHEAIRRGDVTVAFRRWKRPSVRSGGTLRTPAGVLAIDEVARIEPPEVTDADAALAGHADAAAALAATDGHDGALYRVRFHRLGDDPRLARRTSLPDPAELDRIAAELGRIDARSRRGAWTRPVLELIEANPGRRAPELAALLGRETQPFKRDVRRLKELGLTVSLPVGYELSPRGHVVLAHLRTYEN